MTSAEHDELRKLRTPLNDVLMGLGHSHFGWAHHFETHTLFWSVSRLMTHYQRIVDVYDPWGVGPNNGQRGYLDVDLEAFIIRVRIILNDLAFIIRQLYPASVRDMPGPGGPGSPHNHELSMNDLLKFHRKHPTFAPMIRAALLKNESWMIEMRKQRDAIVHYKGQVVIFVTSPLSFAIHDAAPTTNVVRTPEGGKRVVTTKPVTADVFDFVQRQTSSLLHFMHVDLAEAILAYAAEKKMKYQQFSIDGSWFQGHGAIWLFNSIERAAARAERVSEDP